ncbi:MAG: DUF1549 domain-containing protein [Akkermansiaceae bacterium]
MKLQPIQILLLSWVLLAVLSSGQIHPVILDNCTKCHGGVKQKGGLDLRTINAALKGGDTESALVPGNADESPIFKLIQEGSDPHMPPKKQLSPEDIEALGKWITDLELTPPKELILPDPKESATKIIDQLIEAKWKAEKVQPSTPASDQAFVRRLYLDLLGRIPKASESRTFLADQDSHKREILIDRLTESKEHADHLASVFNVVFLDRAAIRKRNPDQRKAWLGYLQWAFHSNRPWDQIGRDLVLARPKSKEDRGASWFIHEQRDDHNEVAKRVSRTLLGKQVQCAQCHNHPVAPEIEQRHYWGLVAFFNRSLNVKTPEGPRVAERASGGYDKFANLEGKSDQSQLVIYSNEVITEPGGKQTKESRDLYAVAPPDQWLRKLKKDEKLKKEVSKLPVPKFSRREAFANTLTTDNPDFSRAIINRIWALMFGRGLVHPVDLMDSAHPPSHPELLAWLARDFESRGYNLRRLIRQLAKSKVYQLDSRPVPSSGRPPLDSFFARALEKPLSAESLARSLRVALEHDNSNDESLRRRLAGVFPELFAENFSPSIQQTMFFSNSPLFDQLIAKSPLLKRLTGIQSNRALAREIFEAILSRSPDSSEMKRSLAFLQPRNPASIQHFCWALITSAEFRMNH